MKIITKKSEKKQQQETGRMLTDVARANYSRGYDSGLEDSLVVTGMTVGAMIISSTITTAVVNQAYKRKMLKYADNDFNLDKTFAKLVKEMNDISAKDPSKGYKDFTKFLFKYARKGFGLYNLDIAKLVLITGFDTFRDHVAEMGNLASTLTGEGSATILESYKRWYEYGTNVFPYGRAVGWKDLLSEDYKLNSDIVKFRAIVARYMSGTMTSLDVIEGNQLIDRLQSSYAGYSAQVNNQTTKNCAAYQNARHFLETILDAMNKAKSDSNVVIEFDDKALVITKFSDSSVNNAPQPAKPKKSPIERQFDKIFHKDQRTMVPPQNNSGEQQTPNPAPQQTPNPAPQNNSEAEEKSEQNLLKLAAIVKKTTSKNSRRSARTNLHNAVKKHCADFNYTLDGFLNDTPEVKEVY